jgi:uncharacterized membrane protein
MKIFVKPNPFWEMIWWILGVILIWTTGSLMSYYADIVFNNPIKSIGAYFGLGTLMGLWIFCILGIIFCGIRQIYITHKKSYPQKYKNQRSNTKQMTQEESNYEVNKYKNNLKLNL